MSDNWDNRVSNVRGDQELQPNWRTPDLLNDRELLKEQFYLKQFLFHLQTSPNLPTLSNPELLVNIQRENERLQKELEIIRSGRREEMLNRKLLSLGKEAEGVMQQMKEFKAVREY